MSGSISELEERSQTEQTEDTSSSENDTENEQLPYVKLYGNGAIGGIIRDLFFTGQPEVLSEEQNIGFIGGQPKGEFAVVLEDPYVLDGVDLVRASEAEDQQLARDIDGDNYNDYYVLGDSENAKLRKDMDDNITLSTNDNQVEMVDEFQHDKVVVWLNGSAGTYLARTLDLNGGVGSRIEDGDKNNGLIEYPDSHNEDTDDDRSPRVTRYPIPRPDIQDEKVLIWLEEGQSESGHTYNNGHVLVNDGSSPSEMPELEPTQNNISEHTEYESYVYWDENIDGDLQTDNNESSGQTNDEIDVSLETNEGGFTESEQTFIDNLVEEIQNEGYNIDQINFDNVVEKHREQGNIEADTTVDELKSAVEEKI